MSAGRKPGLAPELLSLRWRNEALLALSSAGVLGLEDEIVARTDRLFHAGRPPPELSERIFGSDHAELHRWIDTVPGSGSWRPASWPGRSRFGWRRCSGRRAAGGR